MACCAWCCRLPAHQFTKASKEAAMTSTPRSFVPFQRPAAKAQAAQRVRRAVYRERDVGIGYGNSSGYASERRYARDWTGQPRFRCG
jgi:hypothetical protein